MAPARADQQSAGVQAGLAIVIGIVAIG